jgi:quinol monooxygenase YgiN
MLYEVIIVPFRWVFANRLVFVEQWASIDAVRAHFAVPASRAFVAEMRALSPKPPAIRIYTADDVTAALMG